MIQTHLLLENTNTPLISKVLPEETVGNFKPSTFGDHHIHDKRYIDIKNSIYLAYDP